MTKQYKTGVIVGKFYPPHKGHHYLIRTGIENTDQLTVIVCAKKDQFVPGELRVRWLKEIHPEADIILADDNIPENLNPEDYSKAWAKYTVGLLGFVPDVAFTSEEYGARWTTYMGCKHFLVDIDRAKIPCSGTMVRSNPLKYLDFLEPCVRSYFVKRVCVLGAESTGTTTMAKALAEHYKTVWVPEFGRIYWEGKLPDPNSSKWQTDEFIFIANKQNEIEDYLAKIANKILICDTDFFATSLWHERYMGFMSPNVDKLSLDRRYDLYFLTDTDIPFVQDGTRDGEHIRQNMNRRFEEELKKKNKKFVLLSGTHKNRLVSAIKECDRLLN